MMRVITRHRFYHFYKRKLLGKLKCFGVHVKKDGLRINFIKYFYLKFNFLLHR